MEYVSLYLELMADMRFAVLSSSFFLGLIILVGLLGALGKKEGSPLNFAAAPEVPVDEIPVDVPMMWGGESEKKKKPAKGTPISKAAPAESLPPPSTLTAHSAPAVAVDVHLHEALVRRIAALEADAKREPLYLDPLINRITALEKKADELLKKSGEANNPADSLPEGFSQEYQDLKNKVIELQRVLENLSESPTPPPQ